MTAATTSRSGQAARPARAAGPRRRGLAGTVAQATDLFDAVDPDLTLRGIREIWLWERARG